MKKILLPLAVLAILCGLVLSQPRSAFADGTCSNLNQSLSSYQSQGCAYWGQNYFGKSANDNVHLNVLTAGLTGNVDTAVQQAMGAWNTAPENIALREVTSGHWSNEVQVSATYGANWPGLSLNFSNSCGSAWAVGDSGTKTVWLNQYVLNSCMNSSGNWTALAWVIAHEFGHTFGLAHNSSTTYGYQLMKPGVIVVGTPQTMDVATTNAIYPWSASYGYNTVTCATRNAC